MENILITGGAGFIGAHLSRALLKDGHNVVVADDFTLGGRENVADCLENPNFTLVEQDVTDTDQLVALMEKHHIDRIYHWLLIQIFRKALSIQASITIRPSILRTA